MVPFKQMLAGFGIGAAQVNTQVQNPTLMPGETLYGAVHIRGGNVAQSITDLVLTIETEYQREINDSTMWQAYTMVQQRLSDAFVVQPGETITFPFALVLPLSTPLSIGQQQAKLRTRLAVPNAVDPSDTDPIFVQPHPLMRQVLSALETLGFRLYSAGCKYSRSTRSGLPFVQEIELRPVNEYRHDVEELELIFQLHANGLDVLLEIDRRARGLSGLLAEAYDLNECFTRLHLPPRGIDQQALVRQLDGTIRQALASGQLRP
jgi:sporulation-control protein